MLRVGEAAWLLELGSGEEVVGTFRALAAADRAEVRDLVPGARSLLVVLAPEAAAAAAPAWLAALEAGGGHAPDRPTGAGGGAPPTSSGRGRVHEIPVRYDGPDLEEVARRARLDVGAAVALHAAATYRVAFLGFRPGFAYLSGLPGELCTPRRASPRPQVPAGSVAIGGEWTGIYPATSPGGWNLIGSAEVALFESDADPPALLAPGDVVRFVAA